MVLTLSQDVKFIKLRPILAENKQSLSQNPYRILEMSPDNARLLHKSIT